MVFTAPMRAALTAATDDGVNILVSGSHIGTDAWDQIYPYEKDMDEALATQKFIRNTLGYKWVMNFAGRSGEISFVTDSLYADKAPAGSFHTSPTPEKYCVETPDGISPAGKNGKIIMRYSDTDIPAGIRYDGVGYRTVCMGFPIEALKNEEDINTIIRKTLEYFKR